MQIERNPKEAILPLLTHTVSDWIEEADAENNELNPAPLTAAVTIYDPDADAEFQTLMLRCATLRAVVNQARMDHMLTHDQALVLQHTLGYLHQGVDATNHILQHCPETGTRYYLKNPLRGNPISCARIRARIPGTTSRVNCNCEFPYLSSYPTPLLHLQGPPPGEEIAEALGQDYVRAQQHWLEATRQLLQVQQSLSAHLQQTQKQEITLSQGKLRLTGEPDKPGCFEMS